MPKTKISEYSATAASNTDIDSINLSEGVMVPSDLNNAIREQMAHLKDFSDGTSGIDVLNLQDDDGSASIKIQAPATVTTTTTFTLPDGDGSNGQVLSTNGSGTLAWSAAFSSGMLMPYAGSSAPSGWLLCYGQAISRTTYAALFAIIGTTYGSGDGSTTFNVPDLRGRVIAGQDDMGGSSADRLTSPINGDTLGAAGGSESHTLTTSEMPSHNHSITSTARRDGGGPPGGYFPHGSSFGTDTVLSTVGLSLSIDNTGGGAAHNNVQPTIILNYIIKT